MTQDSNYCNSTETNTAKKFGRRAFLGTAGTSIALGLAGCTGGGGGSNSGDGPFAGQTLRVTTWSGEYTERFRNTIKPWYEEESGGTLEVIPGWSELISQIRSAPENNPPYDVTITDGYFYYQGRSDDLFEPVRYDNVPNYEGVHQFLKEFRGDNNEYGVPVDGEPIAMPYNSDIDFDPTSWSDLQSDEAEKITLEGGFYAYPMQIGAIIADDLEGTDEMYDEQYHDAPWEALSSLDVASWYSSGAEVWEHLSQGIANIGQYYYATSKIKARDDSTNLDLVVPEVTGGYFDNFCVVRGTDKRDMAEHYLNFLLDPEIQSRWSEESWEVKSHSECEYPDFVAEDLPTTNEEMEEQLNFPNWEYLTSHSDKFNQDFNETKQSS
ncbi:extracellular solute-binding protein [Halostella sp. JP-L12]|uniref:ABC transporter substrate-binding protein n=1 Tax=Halostella TaxID=1843185 RepID=UPI000EF7CF59|nr:MULTISPECIES: extracellular solute-binding protein [Halostella]NHN49345.1 extracellular solute-binding protein [Halostella sp. JP-L12]